jgi:Mg-chelatase subunit ChlD
MKKLAVLIIVLAALAGAGYVAVQRGWMPRRDPGTQTPAAAPAILPQTHPAALPSLSTTAGAPSGVGAEAAVAAPAPIGVADFNVLARHMGARVEAFSSQYDTTMWAASRAIDGDPGVGWSSARGSTFPHEIVFSFLGQEPVLLTSVAINPHLSMYERQDAKDVEIWISTESATAGFVQVGKGVMRQESSFQAITFAPIQARYLKVRLLSNYGAQFTSVAEIQAFEGRAANYTPLVLRSAGMDAVLTAATAVLPPVDAAIPAGDGNSCAPVMPVPPTSLGPPSQKVLVIAKGKDDYSPLELTSRETRGHVDYSFYDRVQLTRVSPEDVVLTQLAQGYDTVVLSQLCAIKTQLSDQFKRALVGWVSLGHKLIIQDSDDCGESRIPDYSFLPYKFASSNPGARGAAGDRLLFVEENSLGNGRSGDPAFLDLPMWLSGRQNNNNEIGDSNTITQYAPQWCGHLFGTNVLKKNGFMTAYAHYGKGLIIYDGFDNDQANGVEYRQLATRELAQPVNPDGLSCSARLGDFVITTEQRLKDQPLTPGRTYQYPLTLLSNQGYSGTLRLSLAMTPADPSMTYRFEPDTVALSEISQAALTVQTTAQTPPTARALAVRGTDAQGRSNGLCLQLIERRTGAIKVASSIDRSKPASKNIEIVLDVSGSMKLALGKTTRWRTALDTLKQVVGTLPDDFNVGLRVYAHRRPASSRETCTDTELLVPIRKLDRARIESSVARLQPRGETPLIYSILKTPEDLKAAGGGSVVVITDGEDTCHGDAAAAAAHLKSAGLDLTLNIVGFTLKGKAVQDQLATLARATGGEYYGAQNGPALARALWVATIDKIPYTILDGSGKTVASGEAGAPPDELPPGDYTVVVKVADQELREPVTVQTGSDAILKVVLKGDRFVIER